MTAVRPATDASAARQIREFTAGRILTVADAVLGPTHPRTDVEREASSALSNLVGHLIGAPTHPLAWLLLTAVSGAFPPADDVRALHRAAQLGGEQEVTLTLLDLALGAAQVHQTADRPMRLVTGIVVDVDASARSDFHNGIQRVARATISAWRTHHEIELVAWTDTAGITRDLTPVEVRRAAHWGMPDDEVDAPGGTSPEAPKSATEPRPALVVPWESIVVLPEVPLVDRCPPLSALAELSGNAVVAIGYDAIPVISADLRPPGEPDAFAAYLAVVKHSSRVAAISTSAKEEFAGFAHSLTSQGLRPPNVREIVLPSDVPPPPRGYVREEPAVPQVLCVGRLEPHKNHSGILQAADRLWREGLAFDLTLVGADGWSTTVVDRQLRALARDSRPIHRPGSISDDEMWRLVRDASFSVFVSVHEGFGLPVAESLACGTPVITTSHGSQAQIAEQGGCLTVDPRNDDAIFQAMRALLTEPNTLRQLRAEAATRPARTWEDYAHDLWRFLIDGGDAR